jgi:mannitol-1-phosphate/altronate dehydrogenase
MINADEARKMTLEAEKERSETIDKLIDYAVSKAAGEAKRSCTIYSKDNIPLNSIRNRAEVLGYAAKTSESMRQMDPGFVTLSWN